MADEQAQNDTPNRQSGGEAGQGGTSSAESKPQIGDSRPAPKIGDSRPTPQGNGDQNNPNRQNTGDGAENQGGGGQPKKRRRRRGGRGRGRGGQGGGGQSQNLQSQNNGGGQQKQGGRPTPVEAITSGDAVELDEKTLKRRRGRTRKGKAVGRYLMCVNVGPKATQIATLEGRKLVEHQVSRPADDISQIHGNIYLGRVQNVLPGMEAAFVDIATPKNAVLYAGDVQYDADDLDSGGKGEKRGAKQPRIEDVLKAKQSILTQVTKNPIAHKGARLTQEVSLPGRFVVLVPNSSTYGISKRLPDGERKRLRSILDKAKPKQHGVIVRTAAENVTAEEIQADVARLLAQWDDIEKLSKTTKAPALLYREPEAAVRIIREEFTKDFRGVIIDDKELYEEIKGYVEAITPALADRIEYYDEEAEGLPLFERQHIDEQLRKALDRKVWLPGGGSLIIEGTEALTVIDVNTGKNVGKSSLEETVFRNNLEAAEEVAKQLRLRDIGGIIVIDFVDMEVAKNRDEVIKTFRQALARDKTRTQVFDISELGLVEMTRKRIGEGLLESVTTACDSCDGRGHAMIDGILN
ncbi:MAG: ribonuclease E/G [Acidimicrobiaceae bacterium]|jgi:ribonuclease E|nr:ribonuclease E/G [Acidimicrobiaceae bacterium]HAB58329.1 ribonuclease E/G [Acidimicrobiaceae bacterium]